MISQFHASTALPREKFPLYPSGRKLGKSQNDSDRRAEVKILPLSGFEHRLLDCSAAVPTALSPLPHERRNLGE
jgi:hypothetical protein